MNLHLPGNSGPQSQIQQPPNKPRVAFMYQTNIPSSPMAPIQPNYLHSFPESNTKSNKNINANKSPQRVYNKQNQTASPTPLRVFEVPVSHEPRGSKNAHKNSESQCFKSQMSNFSGVSRYNSPGGNTLPPLSPKITQRKSNSKCPSFLSNKNKNQDQQTIEVSPPTNIQAKFGCMQSCKCGKPPTHRTQNNEKFCSKCSIKKMIEGIKLIQLQKIAESFNQPSPFDISTVSRSTNGTRMSSSINKTSEKFIKQVQQEKENLQKHYKQNFEGEDKNISTFYKERKTELKTHYQKIKMAIKESIEQDLKQLQMLQKEQVQQWRRNAYVLEDDIKQLQNIEASLKNDQSFLLQESYMNLYQDILSRNRLNRLSKGTRLAFDIDALSVSAIQNGNSNNTSNLNITIVLKNFNINAEVYRSEIYRMVSSNPNSERSSSRYSEIVPTNFQNCTGNNTNLIPYLVQPEQRNKNKIQVIQPYINLNCNQKQNNILFSFEAKRRDITY